MDFSTLERCDDKKEKKDKIYISLSPSLLRLENMSHIHGRRDVVSMTNQEAEMA
jgi:hypothetical protein